jgi:hypothetical protein
VERRGLAGKRRAAGYTGEKLTTGEKKDDVLVL